MEPFQKIIKNTQELILNLEHTVSTDDGVLNDCQKLTQIALYNGILKNLVGTRVSLCNNKK